MILHLANAAALAFYLVAWIVYARMVASRHRKQPGLQMLMHARRRDWMREMSRREVRIVDTAIMGTLQNGTAFFASSSLIAIGGAATLLRSTDDALRLFNELPFAAPMTRGLWEIKAVGLLMIFGYAFFKFAWAYRLFNYAAILIGATPSASSPDAAARERAANRAAEMDNVAGRHFALGQRALFFSFAYLGWFIGPIAFVLTTILIIVVIYRRQFASDALAAVMSDDPAEPAP
jgi:uncharacterized membrane protein